MRYDKPFYNLAKPQPLHNKTVTLAEYTQLINLYTAGELNSEALQQRLEHLFESNPDINLTKLLASTQQMLQDRQLKPKDFRKISELITELNIKQAISQHSDAVNNSGDETLIMRNKPGEDINDETLIMVSSAANSAIDETIIENRDEPTNNRPSGKKSPKKPAVAVKIGDVLKNRFELVELLGHGGMGMVYKARDKVKVQARDNNPYVAIKVLTEAFKKHSRAFIALQREASKSQRLAHPNIATVYDFDHDGGTIYMTMELLHGQPFDNLLNQLPPGGLPQEDALRYIQDLSHGLSYAHKQRLIHCDLKPANIFLCTNDTVKLLDFGITRAIKKEQQASRDETLFDPATLKALTPAYASVEMFRGDPPDPRDDIYALACVACELLTGMHPYKKVAAHKALELDLKPPTIKGFSRRQQKALNKALALERHKRTATVEEFLEGIQKPKSHVKQLAIGGAMLVLMAGGVLGYLLINQLKQESTTVLIETIRNGDQTALISMLNNIGEEDKDTRAYLTSVLRKEIINYYQERINAVKQEYDFPEAIRLLNEVKRLYVDSAQLKQAERKLLANRKNFISVLVESHKKLTEQNKDTRRILEILKEADPEHPLLAGDK